MSSRLRLRPIRALASATIEHLHLLFRHHLVKRQRRGLEIVFGHMRRLEVAIAILAAYQRGPIPLSHRLRQMRRDIADGEPDAAGVAAGPPPSVGPEPVTERCPAGFYCNTNGRGVVGLPRD